MTNDKCGLHPNVNLYNGRCAVCESNAVDNKLNDKWIRIKASDWYIVPKEELGFRVRMRIIYAFFAGGLCLAALISFLHMEIKAGIAFTMATILCIFLATSNKMDK